MSWRMPRGRSDVEQPFPEMGLRFDDGDDGPQARPSELAGDRTRRRRCCGITPRLRSWRTTGRTLGTGSKSRSALQIPTTTPSSSGGGCWTNCSRAWNPLPAVVKQQLVIGDDFQPRVGHVGRAADGAGRAVHQGVARIATAEPIAVVGIGCRLPGGVVGPESYQFLTAGEGRDR